MPAISRYRSRKQQLRLFDNPVGNHGNIRCYIGEYFEKLTAILLDGERHITDTRCEYCPDISKDNHYFEVKSCGLTEQVLIYAGRLEKDYKFSMNQSLRYVIWQHILCTKSAVYESDLFVKLTMCMTGLYIVPFKHIYDKCMESKQVIMNTKYGRSDQYPDKYGRGYRLDLSKLQDWRYDLRGLLNQDSILSLLKTN